MTPPLWYEIIIITLYGLVMGSFSTALAWRSPRGMGWALSSLRKSSKNFSAQQTSELKDKGIMARSQCPACGHKLGIKDLIPVLSWLSMRGKCRYCGTRVSFSYPLIEMATLAGLLGLWAIFGFSALTFLLGFALPFLIALLVIDIRYMILPDDLIIASFFVGIVFWSLQSARTGEWHLLIWRLGAAVVYGTIIWLTGRLTSRILDREALGFGDVKFFALAGLWLGFYFMPVFFICAGLLGIFWGIVWRVFIGQSRFPFGPALIVALYICFLLNPFYTL